LLPTALRTSLRFQAATSPNDSPFLRESRCFAGRVRTETCFCRRRRFRYRVSRCGHAGVCQFRGDLSFPRRFLQRRRFAETRSAPKLHHGLPGRPSRPYPLFAISRQIRRPRQEVSAVHQDHAGFHLSGTGKRAAPRLCSLRRSRQAVRRIVRQFHGLRAAFENRNSLQARTGTKISVAAPIEVRMHVRLRGGGCNTGRRVGSSIPVAQQRDALPRFPASPAVEEVQLHYALDDGSNVDRFLSRAHLPQSANRACSLWVHFSAMRY